MNSREMARILGSRGGRARARRLPAERRQRIAAMGATARMQSLETARRIIHTLEYAYALRELRGAAPGIESGSRVDGPLPGIYPSPA